jgi:hypothetical protein
MQALLFDIQLFNELFLYCFQPLIRIIYETVTNLITERLEAGIVPWHMP